MKYAFLFIIILIIITALLLIFFPKEKTNINNFEAQNSALPRPSPMPLSKTIRQPAVAGQFYPADKNELSQMIDEFLTAAKPPAINGQPQILIVPHAGYVFSGRIAAYGFKVLANYEYDTVIVLGSSHNYPLENLALYNGDAVTTPLGEISVNKELTEQLIASNKLIYADNTVHAPEHSLEVEIPFLQKTLNNNFKLVLGLVNSDDPDLLAELAKTLAAQTTPKTLIIISSDLTHYPNYEDAIYSDTKIINSILTKDANNLTKTINSIRAENRAGLETCACGASAIKIGLLIADKLNLMSQKIYYSNSGDTPEYGDKERVVGYGAVVFSRQGTINKEQGKYLNNEGQEAALGLVRNTLELAFGLAKEKNEDYKKFPIFNEKRGAFVTLKKDGQLRGCVGLIEPVEDLGQAIIEMTKAAAFNDSRFAPLTKEELNSIEIEISVLTLPQKISEPEKEIELGKHGVIVRQGSHSGVFLPQVAEETGWDLEEFMGQLCSQKAGLSPDCWKNKSVDIYTFEAQVIEE